MPKTKLTAAQEKFYNKYGKNPRPHTLADDLLQRMKKRVVKMLEGVKYPCGFDEDSRCINFQDGADNRNACCCGGCYYSFGFFRDTLTDESDIDFYIENFTKTGFYRKKIGCVLPREKRSTVCLSYVCWNVSQKMTPEHLTIHSTATDLLRTIEYWHEDNVGKFTK